MASMWFMVGLVRSFNMLLSDAAEIPIQQGN